jgi:hypothetical protein
MSCSRWAPEHPAGGASIWHLEQIRSIVRRLAEEAGLRDTESLARSFHILMKGSIVAASEGDTQAAQRGKSMASCSSSNIADSKIPAANLPGVCRRFATTPTRFAGLSTGPYGVVRFQMVLVAIYGTTIRWSGRGPSRRLDQKSTMCGFLTALSNSHFNLNAE